MRDSLKDALAARAEAAAKVRAWWDAEVLAGRGYRRVTEAPMWKEYRATFDAINRAQESCKNCKNCEVV